MEQEQVARQDRDPTVCGRSRHAFRVAPAQGERLFHEARLPGLDTLQRDPRVRRRRRRDHHRVRPAQQVGNIGRHVGGRVLLHQALAYRGVGVADRRQLRLRQASDRTDVVSAPGTGADHAHSESGHR